MGVSSSCFLLERLSSVGRTYWKLNQVAFDLKLLVSRVPANKNPQITEDFHPGLAITSTGQCREHTPQLTRLQQDGSLTRAGFNLKLLQIETIFFPIPSLQ